VIQQFCDWLAATPVSQTFQDLGWFVPLVQTLHILSIAVVMTSVGMLDFKLLGLAGRTQSLAEMVSNFMPWVWSALVIQLITGALLTITEPSRELMNLAFRLKMLMVLAVAAILLLIQGRLRRDAQYWGLSPGRRRAARVVGGSCLLLLVSIVVAGRWIAYI
jgi:cbb3-type cytochrome oxidase subunit 1